MHTYACKFTRFFSQAYLHYKASWTLIGQKLVGGRFCQNTGPEMKICHKLTLKKIQLGKDADEMSVIGRVANSGLFFKSVHTKVHFYSRKYFPNTFA